MSGQGIWGHDDTTGYSKGIDLVGYKVEANDGGIGKIDKHSEEVGASLIVVDTGVWIFGKHVLLPAGVITRIDTEEQTVYVNRSKEQIKNAPEFDEAEYGTGPSYLEQFARYYNQPHM
ncbi:PRC-barrel domain containing protein [Streptomyces sp. H27-H1]|uniref:PRC-barrel domain containing protein n=1 Tax=Streptomyces sp. H27-H1 TaxID=2996461 RepID=UPI00226E3538|nr:PRC-barrel domain containing protein [Streptomyces sp. H27-H1]MCY0925384.1 PRC-barrel domain containing protein [Streptomyces sp. H27-H1]